MDKSGLRSCLLGFVLCVLSPFLGGFGWIARLLGCIGVANGTAGAENRWLYAANRLSVAAVAVYALLEICMLTGLFALPVIAAAFVNLIFPILCAVCLLLGLRAG